MTTMQKVGGNLASACCLLSTDCVVTVLTKSAQTVVDLIDGGCGAGTNTVRRKVAFHEQRYSTAPVHETKTFVSEDGKGTYEELDVPMCMKNSTFPIKPEELIHKAKEIMAMEFGTKEGCNASQYLAEDFQFVAPIIGPLSKEEFLRAFGGFKVKDALPDLKDNAWFTVDPLEPNRVWFMSRATGTHTGPLNFGATPIQGKGAEVRMPPQAQSMLFDKDGKCYTLTVGYCMDKRIGNTDGLGGMFGIVKATGNALPFPEGQRLYNPSLRFEGFEHIAKAVESMGYDPNTMKPLPAEAQK